MAYTPIDNPSETAFNTKLYTGNAGTQSITGVGFQPDWTWIKDRTAGFDHVLQDSVRGTTKIINSNQVYAEFTNSASITSFNSDGFTTGSYVATNNNNTPFVSWNWKAGTSFTNDASSTGIGNIDSAGSVNQDAGFSICSFTGNGSNSQTLKHGLSQAPELIILKARGQATYGWITYDAINGAGKYMVLNNTGAATADTGMWSNTAPTSSVFSLSNGGNVAITNPNGVTMISYCFHSVQGYSKIGSYTGNGNADGTFVYTGFKPAWFMCKKYDAGGNWIMFDNKREPFNLNNDFLQADLSDAEVTGNSTIRCDFVSNGVKLRGANNAINTSGGTYIYLAFAENPFVTSTGIPSPAR